MVTMELERLRDCCQLPAPLQTSVNPGQACHGTGSKEHKAADYHYGHGQAASELVQADLQRAFSFVAFIRAAILPISVSMPVAVTSTTALP